MGLGGTARLHEAGSVGEDDGLDTIPQAEFCQDAGDMRLDRSLADEQPGADLRVGQAAGDETEYLKLTLAQLAGLAGRVPSRFSGGIRTPR